MTIRRTIRAALVVSAIVALGGCSQISSLLLESLRHPSAPFDAKTAPPAPDYSRTAAWMAFPGRDGLERSTPPGVTAIDEASAPADLFFIHPTTYLKNDVWNAPYDASNTAAPYNAPVLLGQISAFNGCCRLYAPQYRQASLYSLNHSQAANDLAYADVAAAFRYYIAHENNGRPFIIASHSQGSGHAVKLLQVEILGTPLLDRLVAAYVVGAYAPSNFAEVGLPTCDSARQTGCIVSWNTSQTGRKGARMLVDDKIYWWRGAQRRGGPPAICVNPLTWNQTAAAPASANAGSLPLPKAPFPTGPSTLPSLVPHLTGAVCHQSLLDVDVPRSAPPGFRDILTLLYGSYHVNDYGLFYPAIRANASDRVAAWMAAHAR
jgi:hypothetical protein